MKSLLLAVKRCITDVSFCIGLILMMGILPLVAVLGKVPEQLPAGILNLDTSDMSGRITERLLESGFELFTEEELYRLWIGDVDIEAEDIDEGTGEQYRWNHVEWRVIQIQNRYFEIARMAGNTEYQENEYDCQPIEVEPYKVTITSWRPVKNV